MVYEPDTDTVLVGDDTRLLRLPRAGGAVEEVGTGFGRIGGLTFDADGVLYVADQGDGVIWEVAAAVPAIAVPTSGLPALLARALAWAGTALANRWSCTGEEQRVTARAVEASCRPPKRAGRSGSPAIRTAGVGQIIP